MKQTATAATPRRFRMRATSRAAPNVERLDHLAGGVDAFGYGQPIAPRHVGFDDILVGVPEVFLVGAPDLDDVAEALGRHHGGARQAARDQGVGRDRGAVREQRHLGRGRSPALETPPMIPSIGIAGRRGLLDADEAGGLVHDADVGEGAADINSHAKVLHDTTSFRTRARHLDVGARARAHPDRGSGCREQLVRPAKFRGNAKIIRRSPPVRLTLSAGRFVPESINGPISGLGRYLPKEQLAAARSLHGERCRDLSRRNGSRGPRYEDRKAVARSWMDGRAAARTSLGVQPNRLR